MSDSRTVFITRRAEFSAAHVLANPEFTDEENLHVYGQCSHPSGHGHNYALEVTLAGPVQPRTGMLMDLKELKEIMDREIISKCDHRHLNIDPDFLRGVIPTAENLALRFFDVLDAALPPGILHRVRVFESPRNYADYYGPGHEGARAHLPARGRQELAP